MKTNTLVLLILCTVLLLAGALLTQHFISGISSTLPPSAEEQIEMQENIPPAQDTVTEKVDEEIALANRLYTPNIQLPAEDKWELSPCNETILPQHNYQGIFCKMREKLRVYPDMKGFQEYFDYSYVRPWYYEREEELIDLIFSTPDNEKWLIFVKSKMQGIQLLKKVREREQKPDSDGKWNSAFVYSESKVSG